MVNSRRKMATILLNWGEEEPEDSPNIVDSIQDVEHAFALLPKEHYQLLCDVCKAKKSRYHCGPCTAKSGIFVAVCGPKKNCMSWHQCGSQGRGKKRKVQNQTKTWSLVALLTLSSRVVNKSS